MQSKIKIATATIVGMNAMIGSGIFTLPGALIFSVGPAGLITTLFVSCAVWFMALTLAKVAEQYPQEGSFYAYAKSWGGHKAGLAASVSFLIGLTIAMGLLCQVAGIFLNHYFSNTDPIHLGLITLTAVTLCNMFGVKLSELGQYILIVLTVFPLLATILLCLTNINLQLLQPFAPFGKSAILLSSKDVIFSFFGFECATTLFNIVENPKKNVPRALTYSILLVSILYIAFAASIIGAIPAHNFNSPDDLPNALLKTFPQYPWLIELIALSIISAIIGTVHSMVWASGSLVKTLSNQIFKNNIFKTTTRSVLAIGFGILATFMLLKERRLFFDLTAIFIIFAYVMSMLALVFTKKHFSIKTNIETILGITTAMVIIGFAIHDLMIILQ